jgi:hypothetical protein
MAGFIVYIFLHFVFGVFFDDFYLTTLPFVGTA